jgi:hypothetical protein
MQHTNARYMEGGLKNQLEPHVCTPEDCPETGNYYVTAIDGGQVFYMAGPYNTHAEALALVDTALNIADKHDGRAWFMSWGTSKRRDGYSEPGSLNKHKLL